MIIVLGAIFFIYYGKEKDNSATGDKNVPIENNSAANQAADNTTSIEDKNTSNGKTGGETAGGGEGSGGGGGGGSSGGGPEPNEDKLPSDLYTAPCGFYFEKYSICNGTCPSGACFQEGRSCYCKT